MRVYLEVIYDIDISSVSDDLRAELVAAYKPTPEEPEPDDEWLCEELAMWRIGDTGLEQVTVIDSLASAHDVRALEL